MRRSYHSVNEKTPDETGVFFALLGSIPIRKARPTGLEPATTGSTVRYSNQLSYGPQLRVSNYNTLSLCCKVTGVNSFAPAASTNSVAEGNAT